MFLASGESDLSFWGRNYLLTHIVFLIVGLTTGYLGDLKMKLEHELSERKRLEEKIRAIERDRVLIETAGAASHEINQPLQGVLGYCELLLQNIDENSPYRQQIEKIQECGEKISTILKKMQTANQYATRTYVQEFKIVDFDAAQSHSKTQKK
jgi:signal transduction histidine kinase